MTAKKKVVKKDNARCKTLRQTIHRPYILPYNDDLVLAMDSERFNEMHQEIQDDFIADLKEFLDQYKNRKADNE